MFVSCTDFCWGFLTLFLLKVKNINLKALFVSCVCILCIQSRNPIREENIIILVNIRSTYKIPQVCRQYISGYGNDTDFDKTTESIIFFC